MIIMTINSKGHFSIIFQQNNNPIAIQGKLINPLYPYRSNTTLKRIDYTHN